MTNLISVVILQAHVNKTKKRDYTAYTLAVPTRFINELKWKSKDAVVSEVREMRIGGKKRKVLIYYKMD